MDTILIADDNPNYLRLFQKTLSKENYNLVLAANGKEALIQCESSRPDLVLLDIVMPGMDGFEVCRKLKANPDTLHIPVIFITAFQKESEHIVEGFNAGGADYISKPFHHAELIMRVRTHLELKRQRDYINAEVKKKTAALKAVLETRYEISSEIEEKITNNIRLKIMPLFETLKKTGMTPAQKKCLKAIEIGITDILSQFMQKLSSLRYGLTPVEIRVACFIREGRSSKEIGELLNLSKGTIDFHRNNIRKKLNLIRSPKSLRAYLQDIV